MAQNGRVSIHHEHPFLPAEGDRNPVRRLRGRLAAPVTVLTAGAEPDRAGLTVSSVLVLDGDPGIVLAVVDPLSELHDAVLATGTRGAEPARLAAPRAGRGVRLPGAGAGRAVPAGRVDRQPVGAGADRRAGLGRLPADQPAAGTGSAGACSYGWRSSRCSSARTASRWCTTAAGTTGSERG